MKPLFTRHSSLVTRHPSLVTAVMLLLTCHLLCSHAVPVFAQSNFDGSLKGVTITDPSGDNKPPTAVIKYTQNGDTFNFDASGSTDTDGTISEYKWDFGDGSTAVGGVVSHPYPTPGNYNVTLTVFDDKGALALRQEQVKITFSLFVNFQPNNVPIPAGFVVDSGLGYDVARKYGWVSPPASMGTRDRNATISPSQEYDTMIHVIPSAKWEAELAPGSYEVTVVMGDPSYLTGILNVQIEGVPIIQNESSSSAVKWIEKKSVYQIDDGRLTMTFIGSFNPARLCFVKINSK